MSLIELILIVYLPLGTLILNIWRKSLADSGRAAYAIYSIVSICMAVLPLVYIRDIEPNQTALEVVLAGVAFFWFAIVSGRRVRT